MSRRCSPGRAAAVVLLACAGLAADKPLTAPEQALLVQRRDALRAVVDGTRRQYDAGRATVVDLLEPSRLLFRTELELAYRPDDRQALCDGFARLVGEAATALEAQRKAGRLSDSAYALARAQCREDELFLLRQRLPERPSAEEEVQLQKSIQALHEAYQVALQALHAEFEAGRGSPETLPETHLRALRAELQLKDRAADPVRACQATLAELQKIEGVCRAAVEARRMSVADYAAARMARLKVEIDLARARIKGPDTLPIKKLLQHRLDVARERMGFYREQFEAGRATRDALLQASAQLLEAELALTQKAANRQALFLAYVEQLKRIEDVTKAQVEGSLATPAAYQQVRAARLAAQLDALRAEPKRK